MEPRASMERRRPHRHSGSPAFSRLLGFLPLSFFLAHLIHHAGAGAPQHILWLCNLSNLTMSIGLFLDRPILVRISVMWLIPGVPLWVWDMIRTGDNPVSTFLSHLGGLTVGLMALQRIRAEKNMWFFAWLYGFTVQLFCRLFTPPDLNVNVAFQMYPGWETMFSVYWHYWIFVAVQAAVGMWLLEMILIRIFPPQKMISESRVYAEIT